MIYVSEIIFFMNYVKLFPKQFNQVLDIFFIGFHMNKNKYDVIDFFSDHFHLHVSYNTNRK